MLSVSLDDKIFKTGLTDRVKRLKRRVADPSPWASSEMAVLITGAYQESEGRPVVIRRAIALKFRSLGLNCQTGGR